MFDKKLCIENIYNLAKEKGLKIGALEEKVGVSVGYLARLSSDSKSSPSVDTLLSFAKELDVSLNDLMYGALSKLTKAEKMMFDFIKKMHQLTEDSILEWEALKFGEEYVKGMSDYPEFNGYTVKDENTTYDYNSKFKDDAEIDREFQIYYKTILKKNKMKIYMIPAWYNPGHEIELYTVKDGELSPICSTRFLANEIRTKLKELYDSVAVNSTFSLETNVKVGIENFINDNETEYEENTKLIWRDEVTDNDADLPFQ